MLLKTFLLGNALHYNGANMYDRTDFSVLSSNATKWTWKVWFKIDAAGTFTLYSHHNSGSYRRVLQVTGTTLQSQVRNGTNATQTWTGTIDINTWYCWFVVFDGAGATPADRVKHYLGKVGTDANLVQLTLAFGLTTPTVLSSIPGGTARIFWGSIFATGNFLNGVMDERAMWNAALTYDECNAMYNGGDGGENLATNCVYYQKLDESNPATIAVEEIAGLNTELINCTFTPGTDGWEAH